MILLIDNYDSFSYNLYQQAAAIEPDMRVVRNDALTVSEIENLESFAHHSFAGSRLSEGRRHLRGGRDKARRTHSDLGVCLGHQAICEAFGGRIEHAQQLMHGKQSEVTVDPAEPLFTGLPEKVKVARYHSLVAAPDVLPDCLLSSRATSAVKLWPCGTEPCRSTA